MLWSVFVLFRIIVKTSIRKTILFSQAKPGINLKLNSKVQTSKDIYKKKRKKIFEFIVDETLIKVDSSEFVWLLVAIIESKDKDIL